MQKIDLTGKVFGKWTVLREATPSSRGEIRWLCKCECGTEKVVSGSALRRGRSKSCKTCSLVKLKAGDKFGKWTVLKLVPNSDKWECRCECGTKRLQSIYTLKNALSVSCGCTLREKGRTHGLWTNKETARLAHLHSVIKDRCTNPRSNAYKNYGGRGIKICDEWLNDVEAFVKWCVSNGAEPGKQIDRIDNNGNYEPSNCRFVTMTENLNNRRCTRFVNVGGKVMPFGDARRIFPNISINSLLKMTVEK